MNWIEPDFWDWRVEPTRHALERFSERLLPPGDYADAYVRWALRDLAIAEGWLAERPPGWSRLDHDAPLYAVVGRLLCMPLRPTPDGGRWQPTTVVTEREPDSWTQALHQGACGSVRRRPSRQESCHRPRSPARDWPSDSRHGCSSPLPPRPVPASCL
jgi:hypothetical protein